MFFSKSVKGFCIGFEFLTGSVIRPASSMPTQTVEVHTIEIPGVVVGDYVVCWSCSVDLEQIQGTAYVNSEDTIAILLSNDTEDSIELVESTLYAIVMKRV